MRASTDPVRVVADFESDKHDIIVLAFNGLETATLRDIGFDEGSPAPSRHVFVHMNKETMNITRKLPRLTVSDVMSEFRD